MMYVKNLLYNLNKQVNMALKQKQKPTGGSKNQHRFSIVTKHKQ